MTLPFTPTPFFTWAFDLDSSEIIRINSNGVGYVSVSVGDATSHYMGYSPFPSAGNAELDYCQQVGNYLDSAIVAAMFCYLDAHTGEVVIGSSAGFVVNWDYSAASRLTADILGFRYEEMTAAADAAVGGYYTIRSTLNPLYCWCPMVGLDDDRHVPQRRNVFQSRSIAGNVQTVSYDATDYMRSLLFRNVGRPAGYAQFDQFFDWTSAGNVFYFVDFRPYPATAAGGQAETYSSVCPADTTTSQVRVLGTASTNAGIRSRDMLDTLSIMGGLSTANAPVYTTGRWRSVFNVLHTGNVETFDYVRLSVGYAAGVDSFDGSAIGLFRLPKRYALELPSLSRIDKRQGQGQAILFEDIAFSMVENP